MDNKLTDCRQAMLFSLGVCCTALALGLALVTLTDSKWYGAVLFAALGLTFLGTVFLGRVASQGGTRWRVAAAMAFAPALFVIFDCLRRLPYLFYLLQPTTWGD